MDLSNTLDIIIKDDDVWLSSLQLAEKYTVKVLVVVTGEHLNM